MKKRNLYLWRMLILAIVMLAAPMVMAAPATPPDVVYPPADAALYPPGIGFNPVVDYRLPQFAQSPNIRKFVDSLPGLGATNANNLGQYIPVAVADTTSFPGSDYYEIGLSQYTKQMHRDLPPTQLRGYYQINGGIGADHTNNYLGPAIVANRDRPVRIKFVNNLGFGDLGNLPIPVDMGIMGAGMGPTAGINYTQNRADLHLHGSLSPWISDGTPHQWVTPAGDTTITGGLSYQKGASFQNVPDMVAGPTSIVNGIQVPCAASKAGPATCFTPTASDGIGTYFHPNVMSSRLMFYHDHSLGITRLNVYAGEAAPYLLTDNVEQDLINGTNASGVFDHIVVNDQITSVTPVSVLPGLGTPLVFQDKTFVNGATTPPGAGFPAPAPALSPFGYVESPKTLATDPLWAYYTPPYDGPVSINGHGGSPDGSLWIGHEYLPVENPYDPSGNTWNGRWDYAPFMIPAMLPQNLVLPSPTIIPEGFQDTAVVNGTAFPYVELPPNAVRFRMLNACNDRSLNLQLYKADPLRINVTNGGSGYTLPPVVTVTGGGATTAYTATATLFKGVVIKIDVTNASGFTFPGAAGYTDPIVTITPALGDTTGIGATAAAFVNTEVKMVDAAPNANFPTWPRDGRDGGVPDPTMQAPPWLQIGNEAGFLAKVAVTPQQPIDYNYDRQVIPLVGVTSKSLLLMPAMRADVMMDLSGYQEGDVLIVYNDAPAAMPNYWPINDYFTDDPDNTGTGGAPTTPAGFGPNTRTMMQIRIKGTHTTGLSPLLMQAIPAAFKKGSDPILVPQLAYNEAYPTGDPLHYTAPTPGADNIVQGYQTTMNIDGTAKPISQIRTVAPGNNYTTPPTVVITGGGCSVPACKASATAGLNPIGAITILTAGSGYTSAPTVTLGAPDKLVAPAVTRVQATAAATVSGGLVTAINIVEPGANYTNIAKAPTCTITGGGGTGATCSVMLPTLNTVGSIVLGVNKGSYTSQPQIYLVPNPNNIGAMGASADARLAGDIAMTGKNLTEGFDAEYGRMDVRLGSTPNPLTPTVGAGWVIGIARYIDPPTEIMNDGETILWRLAHLGVDSHAMHFHLFNLQVINHVDWTNVIKPRYDDEIGWRETIRTNPMEDIIVAIKPQSMKLPFPIPNSNRVLDPTTPLNSTTNFYPVPPPVGIPAVPQQSNVMTNFGWEYVWHCHLLGHEENDMMRPLVLLPGVPIASAAPTALAFGVQPVGTTSAAPLTVTLSNTAAAGYLFIGSIALAGTNPGDFAQTSTSTCGANLAPKASCTISVTFTPTAAGARAASLTIGSNDPARPTLTVPLSGTGLLPPVAPSNLVLIATSATSITLRWRDNSNNETGFDIYRQAPGDATFTKIATAPANTGNNATYADTSPQATTSPNIYSYYVTAVNAAGSSSSTGQVSLDFSNPAAPSDLALTSIVNLTGSSARVTLKWTDNSTIETGFVLQRATNTLFTTGLNTVTGIAANSTSTIQQVARKSTYYYRIQAVNGALVSPWSTTLTVPVP